MRASNKILLIFFLAAMGMLGAVHLALYAKFSKGELLSDKNLEKEIFIPYNGPAPSILVLKDNLNVTVIPSDSFSVAWQKSDEDKISYRRSGDSLIVTGDKAGWINPFDERRDFGSLPVTVYCGHLENILLSGCMGRINGRKSPGSFTIDLKLKDAQLRVGGYFEYNGIIFRPPIREFYDSLRIDAIHSNLVLQQNDSIRSLIIRLNERSQFNDMEARIEKPEIHYSDDSRVNISGANLGKLK